MRLLLICGLALTLVPAATAGATKASVALNQASPVAAGSSIDFTVVLDRGTGASVSVECLVGGAVNFYSATGEFPAVPGVATVSPSLYLGGAAGSTCTARLYRWAQKQMVAASMIFTVS